jgi:type IV secretory pathway protease TraF
MIAIWKEAPCGFFPNVKGEKVPYKLYIDGKSIVLPLWQTLHISHVDIFLLQWKQNVLYNSIIFHMTT